LKAVQKLVKLQNGKEQDGSNCKVDGQEEQRSGYGCTWEEWGDLGMGEGWYKMVDRRMKKENQASKLAGHNSGAGIT
jgi:hypothetical protein